MGGGADDMALESRPLKEVQGVLAPFFFQKMTLNFSRPAAIQLLTAEVESFREFARFFGKNNFLYIYMYISFGN